MSKSNIPETYNSIFMGGAGYLLNVNGTASLVYEVCGGIEISDNLECVINCRKRTDVEIEGNKKVAQDMILLRNELKKQKTTDASEIYADIWDIDVSYKVSDESVENLAKKIQKIDKYCSRNEVVLYIHGISLAKQVQSFYPGFAEMDGRLYCVTKEKCKEILSVSAQDLSFFVDFAKNGDMVQIYSGCGSGKVFVAISFLFAADIKVKYKDIFVKIYDKRQAEFDEKIEKRKIEIENILQKYTKFSSWKQITEKESLRQILGKNYEFDEHQFSYNILDKQKYGQIVSISDLTSDILSKGLL
jgi:hypothetical protein